MTIGISVTVVLLCCFLCLLVLVQANTTLTLILNTKRRHISHFNPLRLCQCHPFSTSPDMFHGKQGKILRKDCEAFPGWWVLVLVGSQDYFYSMTQDSTAAKFRLLFILYRLHADRKSIISFNITP